MKLIKRLPICTYNVCHDVGFCQCEAHTTWLDNNLLCLWLWWVLDMWGERLGSHAPVNDDKKKEAAKSRDHKLSDPMYPTRRDIVPNMWWPKTRQMALWWPSMDIYLSIAIEREYFLPHWTKFGGLSYFCF